MPGSLCVRTRPHAMQIREESVRYDFVRSLLVFVFIPNLRGARISLLSAHHAGRKACIMGCLRFPLPHFCCMAADLCARTISVCISACILSDFWRSSLIPLCIPKGIFPYRQISGSQPLQMTKTSSRNWFEAVCEVVVPGIRIVL